MMAVFSSFSCLIYRKIPEAIANLNFRRLGELLPPVEVVRGVHDRSI